MNGHSILLQGDAAHREIHSAVRKEVASALADLSKPIKSLSEVLENQDAVLTLARCADMLGVDGRTVTESYVKRRGLKCLRLARNSSPLFLMADVIAWLRENDIGVKS